MKEPEDAEGAEEAEDGHARQVAQEQAQDRDWRRPARITLQKLLQLVFHFGSVGWLL